MLPVNFNIMYTRVVRDTWNIDGDDDVLVFIFHYTAELSLPIIMARVVGGLEEKSRFFAAYT